jgi:hypothetical protein
MEDMKNLDEQTTCVSIDCEVEELEERIAPAGGLERIAQNHNETMLQDRS